MRKCAGNQGTKTCASNQGTKNWALLLLIIGRRSYVSGTCRCSRMCVVRRRDGRRRMSAALGLSRPTASGARQGAMQISRRARSSSVRVVRGWCACECGRMWVMLVHDVRPRCGIPGAWSCDSGDPRGAWTSPCVGCQLAHWSSRSALEDTGGCRPRSASIGLSRPTTSGARQGTVRALDICRRPVAGSSLDLAPRAARARSGPAAENYTIPRTLKVQSGHWREL